jgi:hypothetical protein
VKTYKRIANDDGSIMTFEIPSHFAIRPHKEAPDFKDFASGQKALIDLYADITSAHPTTDVKSTLDMMRQAGLVNLWFFLKVIAGAYGPYEKLNEILHLDMCNWRQSDSCMAPGARFMALMPRGFRKSTVFSHGANSWLLTRDATQRIRLVNAVISRAEDFRNLTKATIDSNPMYAALYGPGWKMPDGSDIPSRVPIPNSKDWNADRMVMPNRWRFAAEPSIKAAGVTGSGEGDHHTFLDIDDPVGLDAIDWQFQSTVMMENAKKWMNTNLNALLDTPIEDIIGIVGTRYAGDDCYEKFANDAKEVVGAIDEDVIPIPGGSWSIYYRLVQEDGEMISPEIIGEKELAKMDPWTAATQYWNKPRKSGINEFVKYVIKPCKLFHDTNSGLYLISFRDELTDEVKTLNAASLTGVISTDAASKDRNVTALTSRTSVAVHFRDSQNRDFRVWNKVGYMSMDQTFDAIFQAWNLFPGLLEATLFEVNAMQLGLYQLLVKEQEKRKCWINLREVTARGDKIARIRSVVGWHFAQGLIYATPEAVIELKQEKDSFPSKKLDVLDESEKALSWLMRPANEEEVALSEESEIDHELSLVDSENQFGYAWLLAIGGSLWVALHAMLVNIMHLI